MSNKLAILFVTVLLAFEASCNTSLNLADDDFYNETTEQLEQLHDNLIEILNSAQLLMTETKTSYLNSSDEFVANGQAEVNKMVPFFKNELDDIFDRAIDSDADANDILLCFADVNIINDLPQVYKNEIDLCLSNSDSLIDNVFVKTEENCNKLLDAVKDFAERLRHCPTNDVQCISPVAEDIKRANETMPIYIFEQVYQVLINVEDVTNNLEECIENARLQFGIIGDDTVLIVSNCIDDLINKYKYNK